MNSGASVTVEASTEFHRIYGWLYVDTYTSEQTFATIGIDVYRTGSLYVMVSSVLTRQSEQVKKEQICLIVIMMTGIQIL